jgi:glucosylglycerate phosphorylase
MTAQIHPDLAERIFQRAAMLYGPAHAPQVASRIAALIDHYRPLLPRSPGGWSERDALLITYADSLIEPGRAPLASLHQFLLDQLSEDITFVHLLPFFPFSSDDGFSVIDYRAVRPDLGGWEDVAQLAKNFRLVFDGVINHVSRHSDYVKGYLAGVPRYANFCVSPPPSADLSSVTRPRTSPLLHTFEAHDGPRQLWTTFSEDQVDLNFQEPEVLLEILDVLLFYASHGASMIRLDAIPYLWKSPGTSSVHLPQTHQVIKLIRDVFDAASPGMILLSETNVPHLENISYWGDRGDEAQKIYNFTLAPLVLFTLLTGDATRLATWAQTLEIPSERCVLLNITATHDGIGMRPTEGILSQQERDLLVAATLRHGGKVSMRANPDGSSSPYELNITYFDAINDPSDSSLDPATAARRFLLSQAIPMILPGIPGIYIHSLVGSSNDYLGREHTGHPRSINRQRLSLPELEAALADPASRQYLLLSTLRQLLAARSTHPAFHPNAKHLILPHHPSIFAVLRTAIDPADGRVLAIANVSPHTTALPEPVASLAATATPLVPHIGLSLNCPSSGPASPLAPHSLRLLALG